MKKLGFIALGLAAVLLMGGCGGKEEKKATAPANNKKVIVAATEGMVRPLSYVDKQGNLIGYEVDVLKAAAKKAGYEIKFEKTEFTSVFAGVDSGKYQMGFGCLNKTKKRMEKYTYSTAVHNFEPSGFFVPKGFAEKHPIKKIEDLGGMKTMCNAKGDSWHTFVDIYNKKFPNNKIIVQYSDEDWGAYYSRLNSGAINLLKGMESRTKLYADEYGYKYDYISLPQSELDKVNGLADPYKWFIYAKTEEGKKLAAEMDKALVELSKDGTLSKLSIQHLGSDYSSEEAYNKMHQGNKK